MKYGVHIIGLFCTWLLISSCGSTHVAIDVMVYPESGLDETMSKIALLNRVDYSNGFTKQYINGIIVEQYTDMTEVYTNEALKVMKQLLLEDGFVKAEIIRPSYIAQNGSYTSPVIRSKYIQRACQQYKADVILAVEGYDAEIDSDGQMHLSTPVETTYGTVQVPYFDGSQSVQMAMYFRVYTCREDKNLLLESVISTQMSSSSTGDTPYEADSKLPHSDNVLFQAAVQLGYDYVTQITPHWNTIERKLYTSNDERMKRAVGLALDGQWESAIEEWYNIAKSSDKQAGKAAYNLIVASEVTGDLDLAISWATTCLNKYKISSAQNYLESLEARKAEIAKIEKYFPGSTKE